MKFNFSANPGATSFPGVSAVPTVYEKPLSGATLLHDPHPSVPVSSGKILLR